MPEPKLIGREARSETPVELRSVAGRRQALPADLLRQTSRRLQIMSLVGAGLWTLGVGIGNLAFHSTAPEDPRWSRLNITYLIAAANVALSLALYFYLRKRERDPASVVNLSLAYMIVTGLGLAIMLHWGIAPRNAMDVTPDDHLDRPGDSHVRGHRPRSALEDAAGRVPGCLHGSHSAWCWRQARGVYHFGPFATRFSCTTPAICCSAWPWSSPTW